jgi:hypothetical protein
VAVRPARQSLPAHAAPGVAVEDVPAPPAPWRTLSTTVLLAVALAVLVLPFERIDLSPALVANLQALGQTLPQCGDAHLIDYSGISLATTGTPTPNRDCLRQLSVSDSDRLGLQWPFAVATATVALALAICVLALVRRRAPGVLVPLLLAAALCSGMLGQLTFFDSFVAHTPGPASGGIADALVAVPGAGAIGAGLSVGLALLIQLVGTAIGAARRALAPLPA